MNQSEHILECLQEECIEVAKDISKSQRFGLNDRNVLNPTCPTNRERVIDELNDLMAVVEMAVEFGILPHYWRDPDKQSIKINKVRKFMDYARKVGALHP